VGRVLPHKWDDSPRYSALVFAPLVLPVLCGAEFVVVKLTWDEESHVVQRVQESKPFINWWPDENAWEGEGESLNYFTKVIEVTGYPPPTTDEDTGAGYCLLLDEAKEKSLAFGLRTEEELLHIGTSSQHPTCEEQENGHGCLRRVYVISWSGLCEGECTNIIKCRVKDQTAPCEFEANFLSKYIIGIEMDFLTEQVFNQKPAKCRRVDGHCQRRLSTPCVLLR